MKVWKRAAAGAIALSMVCMAACKGGAGTDDKSSDTTAGANDAKGRYLEEKYQVPDGTGIIYDLTRLSDGKLRMIAEYGIFESGDMGRNWELSEQYPSFYPAVAEEASYIENAASDQEGNMFFSVTEMEHYITSHIYISADGTESEAAVDLPYEEDEEFINKLTDETLLSLVNDTVLDEEEEQTADENIELTDEERKLFRELYLERLKPSLDKIKFAADGSLLGCDYAGAVYRIEPQSGKLINTYGTAEEYDAINDFVEVGDKLYVSTAAELKVYDIASESLESTEEVLKEYFTSDQEDFSSVVTYGVTVSDVLLMAGDDNESLYFCDDTGLYRYGPGSTELERVINGDLTSMSNQQIYFVAIVMTENDEYLALNLDGNTGKSSLMNYAYSEEASAVPSKEITVYTLNDSQNLRQAISIFQSQNSDYYVNLEIGMTGDDAVTASDALRTLSTNIMAGNGPDILLLDGMPIGSYIEKDLLLDLSDMVDEMKQSNHFFENILHINNTDNGVYAVPTRFSVPVLMGSESMVNAVSDLKSLADALETLSEEAAGGKAWKDYTIEGLTEILLSGAGAAMVKEDGTMDENALEEFLAQLKRIYDVGKTAGNAETGDTFVYGIEENQLSIDTNILDILTQGLKSNISAISSVLDINTLHAVSEEKDWTYQLFDGISEGNFITMDTVGINAKSSNVEESKEFVKALLQVESQKISVSGGFPVNTDAYDALYTEMIENKEEYRTGYGMSSIDEETGEIQEIYMKVEVRGEEDYLAFKEEIESLTQISDLNQIVEDALKDGAASYVNGDSTLEETVESILQTVNLYLAE